MALGKVLYPTKVHSTGGWKNIVMKHRVLHVVLVSLLAAQAAPIAVWAQAKADPPISGTLGKLRSITSSSIDVLTSSGVVHINITQPLTTYKQRWHLARAILSM